MIFRLAEYTDLPQLKKVYENIICQMKENNLFIWDDIYPYQAFNSDIENKTLYILEDNDVIIAAFVLCCSRRNKERLKWENNQEKVMYIDRFGVNVQYSRKGIGSLMIKKAVELGKNEGAKFIRLLVVDKNEPAINFYKKNGFNRVEGINENRIDDEIIMYEFGFEIKI